MSAPNPHLSSLLRKSKFAQLAKTNQLMGLRTRKVFPTAQTIETPSGSFKHRDYGLKSPLPDLGRRHRIIVEQVDTLENMTAYERAPGDYHRKMKFNDLNIPLSVRANSLQQRQNKNPLFFGKTTERITEREQMSKLKVSEVLNVSPGTTNSVKENVFDKLEDQSSNFLRFLAETSPDKYIKIRRGDIKGVKIDDEIVEFLMRLNKNEDFAPANPVSKIAQNEVTRPTMKATGGLSYKLQGKLTTTPNGAERPGAVVPARLLRSNGDSYQVAVGGFVALASPVTLGNLLNIAGKDKSKHITEQTIPVHVSGAFLTGSGAVQLRVEGVQFKTLRNFQKGKVEIPSRGSAIEVNEDTIYKLLQGYSKAGGEEI